MLGDLDLKRIKDGLGNLEVPLEIIFHPDQQDSDLSKELLKTAKQIEQAAAGSVTVKHGSGEGLPARPGLSLAYRGKSNIHYLAIPEGPEVIPFIEACLDLPKGAVGHDQAWAQTLAGLNQPAQVYVFMATTCPNCPKAVQAAIKISQISHQIESFIIDAQRYQELAKLYKAQSVPLTVIDQGFSKIGVMPPASLAEIILGRDHVQYQGQVFTSLVETSRLEDAAKLVVEKGAVGFVGAWNKSTTSSRMGLLLVVENVLGQSADAFNEIISELVAATKSEDAALRGDTADLLGQIGHADCVAILKTLLDDPNPDVAEIAQDGLDEISAG
ncbi:MAG: thioredoxin family protein [Deltaproteobacteria bacterium]|nr:thioredoxin family protein [Deltaproteobacteria bacterium]